jgi:hypothetical protein
MISDDQGFLWIQPMTRAHVHTGEGWEPPNTSFDLFGPDGRYLGAVAVPTVLEGPFVSGDHLYAWTADSLGVHHVVRYRIEGR